MLNVTTVMPVLRGDLFEGDRVIQVRSHDREQKCFDSILHLDIEKSCAVKPNPRPKNEPRKCFQ